MRSTKGNLGRPQFAFLVSATSMVRRRFPCYTPAMWKDDEKRIADKLTKVMAMMCVRNADVTEKCDNLEMYEPLCDV
jgi:hypothetical protein